MAKIKIKVDLSKVNHIDIIAKKLRFFDFKLNDFYNYVTEVEYNLEDTNNENLIIAITNMLTKGLPWTRKKMLDEKMIEEQVNQLLFAYNIIKNNHLKAAYFYDQRKANLDFFERYIPLQDVLTNKTTSIIDLIIKLDLGDTTKEYKLPKPTNIKDFSDSLLKFVEAYFGKNPSCRFIDKLGSPVNKTLIEEWNKFQDKLNEDENFFLQEIDGNHYKSDVIRRLVLLIKNFPQFSTSRNPDPLITNSQARFIIKFLHLMGFENRQSKINFSKIEPSRSDLDNIRGNLRSLNLFFKRNVSHKYFV